MGLNPHALSFLLASRAAGVSFERTLTVGRQALYMDERTLARTFAAHRVPLSPGRARALLTEAGGYADPLLRLLGAREIETLDVSTYEGSSLVHDMNEPVPASLHRRFSVVVDSGSLEHVFHVGVALRNCMEMAEPGGHVLAISPANSEMGHGFYQLSPELFYRAFAPESGYEVEQLLLRDQRMRGRWYEAADPARAGRRVTLAGAASTYVYVRARRVSEQPVLRAAPQQSDYRAAWDAAERGNGVAPAPPPTTRQSGPLRRATASLVPQSARDLLADARGRSPRAPRWDPELYRAVDVEDHPPLPDLGR